MKKKDKNILLIVSPGAIGGAEIYIENLSEEFLKRSHNVTLLISHHNDYFNYLKSKYSFNVIYLGNNLFEIFKKRKVYFDEINKTNSIISSGYHSLLVSLIIRLGSKFSGTHVDIKHGWVKNNVKDKFMTLLDKTLSVFCHRIVVVNKTMANNIYYSKKVTYIKTGIPINTICPNIRKDSSVLKVAIIGRLELEKRFNLAVDIVERVNREIDAELMIFGDGSEKNRIERRCIEFGIKYNFFNFIKKELIPYNEIDILLITSITEGAPLVALEALLLGVYIISTDVGNLGELLKNDRGLVCKGGFTNLTKTMSQCILNYRNLKDEIKGEMSAKSSNYIIENYSIKRMADDYLRII